MRRALLPILLMLILLASPLYAADTSRELYDKLKAFKLGGTAAHVESLVFVRDRLQMTFTGDFYFEEPIDGIVYGAVFIGRGQFHSETLGGSERESVKRFLNTQGAVVDATFTKAVLRFTDDTAQKLAERPVAAIAPPAAQELATALEQHLVRESGLNLSSRLLLAILHKDNPGVFYAEFDGGNPGRFSALLDHQARTPGTVFNVNGGEKGLIFRYHGVRYGNDVLTAFYNEQDVKRGIASYSDAFDLVTTPVYKMDVDLRDPGNWLRIDAKLQMISQADNLQVVPMRLNEGLGEFDNVRRNKGVRVLKAELADGTPVGVIQEDWETGFSLLLPAPIARGRSLDVTIKLEGKDSLWSFGSAFHYPLSTISWYPRHGYLARSRFDVTYHHRKDRRVASIGNRVQEGPVENASDEWVTRWSVNEPVPVITFVCGRFERHSEMADVLGQQIPIEYYSPPGDVAPIKEDFILGEMANAVRYFSTLFGRYPYDRLGGAFFPTNFGQGFPTLLLLPVRGTADRREFAFMAHETAHQWWGGIVGWRSYRDQWLSEGFADYSGVLYAGTRTNAKDADELLKLMRRDLLEVAVTDTGAARIKVHEIGPLILGTRLNSSRSTGGAELMYNKGGLVLRMLHFLLSNPEANTDKGFFDMMKDFVERHRNAMATTESFFQVAGEHFARSPIGQKYGVKDLNWFLEEWVYGTGLPSYNLEYKVEPREGGGFTLKGVLNQTNVGENWFMPLPLVLEFSGGRIAKTSINARGPKTPIEIRLPEKPQRVRLDPDLWILSERTSEKSN